MGQYLGKGIEHAGGCLLAIVEDDDVARAYLPYYSCRALQGIQPGVEVATQQTPHDGLQGKRWLSQAAAEARGRPAIGRPEIATFDLRLRLPNISQIVGQRSLPSIQMAMGMVAHGMPFLPDPAEQLRVSCHPGANTEKTGMRPLPGQQVEDGFRHPGAWAIVEGEVYGRGFFPDGHLPAQARP